MTAVAAPIGNWTSSNGGGCMQAGDWNNPTVYHETRTSTTDPADTTSSAANGSCCINGGISYVHQTTRLDVSSTSVVSTSNSSSTTMKSTRYESVSASTVSDAREPTPAEPAKNLPASEPSRDAEQKDSLENDAVTSSAAVAVSSSPTGASTVGAAGPDQVLDADRLWTIERDQPVRLRLAKSSPVAEQPVSIVTLFRQVVARSGDHQALAVKVDGSWKTWTFKQYYDDVCTAAKAFIKLGLEPHNGVAILGFNSPEWFISDLGAIFAGGLAAGIYTTNNPEACQYIAHSARCNVIVVENEAQLKKIRSVWSQLPHLKAVVQYHGQPSTDNSDSSRPVYSWSEFMQLADSVPDDVLQHRISRLAINKCCTLIYTSGTTGNPKGVMLSHDNLVMVSKMSVRTVNLDYERETIVSYLPLSHVAAQVLDIYIPLHVAASVYFAQPDALKGSLAVTMREARPTAFLGVPRIWEKMQEKMQSIGAKSGFMKRCFVSWARGVGLRGNQTIMRRDDNPSMPFGWSLAKKLVFGKVRQQLGLDRCKMCMTAAAPISRDTLEFFSSFDLPVMEIYGMSESTGPHTVSRPDYYLTTSAGTPLPGSEVLILNKDSDGTGEVCMDGRNIFMGYLDELEKTREAADDEGLLHSGDIGRVDDDGFLFITGRIKELLITAGGENVAPVPIEDNVKEALPCISNCMLIGDARKFLSILLTLKSEVDHESSHPLDQLTKSTAKWFQDVAGASLQTVPDVIEACCDVKSRVRDVIQAGIDKANRSAPSRAQTIQKWTILPKDFSVSGGELGPTLKMKRPVITKMYTSTIDSLYAETSGYSS